ncbi:MAG: ribonuclease P protein component [Solirubrobacteraceae bacterium]
MDQLPHQLASSRRTKRGRLSRSAEFERVYRQGRSHGGRYLVLHVFPRDAREPADSARLGLSVSRKVGGAVERNRVKRLLREAFAAEADRVPSDHDVVIVARPGAVELCDRDGLTGVQSAIGELLDKAGLPAADA